MGLHVWAFLLVAAFGSRVRLDYQADRGAPSSLVEGSGACKKFFTVEGADKCIDICLERSLKMFILHFKIIRHMKLKAGLCGSAFPDRGPVMTKEFGKRFWKVKLDFDTWSKAPHSVQKSWDNHFAAFGEQNVPRVLEDYTEDSEIIVHNQFDGSQQVFTGLRGVEKCFTNLFAQLHDTSNLAAPVVDVHEAIPGFQPGSVFLVWSAAASGFEEATDTFIFDENSKIIRQNVVVKYTEGAGGEIASEQPGPGAQGPVHDGWANHFGAFGGQDMTNMLKDYTYESVITVYNHADGSKEEFVGEIGVRTLFTSLWASMVDLSDLAAPIQHVEEQPPQVFLVWQNPASGYTRATDTFIFNAEGKILRQNVVVSYTPVDLQ